MASITCRTCLAHPVVGRGECGDTARCAPGLLDVQIRRDECDQVQQRSARHRECQKATRASMSRSVPHTPTDQNNTEDLAL